MFKNNLNYRAAKTARVDFEVLSFRRKQQIKFLFNETFDFFETKFHTALTIVLEFDSGWHNESPISQMANSIKSMISYQPRRLLTSLMKGNERNSKGERISTIIGGGNSSLKATVLWDDNILRVALIEISEKLIGSILKTFMNL